MKRWLYVVQQRLAITNTEASALLTISFLLVVGLVAGEVRSRIPRFTDEAYAESDRLFLEGAQASMGGLMLSAVDTSVATTDSVGAPTPIEEKPAIQVESKKDRQQSTRIDLNTATAAELQELPRIGPALAARIIEYRQAFGPFSDVTEIMEVSGIGEATFARLQPYLWVSEVTPTAGSE